MECEFYPVFGGPMDGAGISAAEAEDLPFFCVPCADHVEDGFEYVHVYGLARDHYHHTYGIKRPGCETWDLA